MLTCKLALCPLFSAFDDSVIRGGRVFILYNVELQGDGEMTSTGCLKISRDIKRKAKGLSTKGGGRPRYLTTIRAALFSTQ